MRTIWHFNFVKKTSYEVGFSAIEDGVGEDGPLQIASENVFDFPGRSDVLRGEKGKLSPFSRRASPGPVIPLVYSCPFGLGIWG